MSNCQPCEALIGKLSDTEPHVSLKKTNENKIKSMGMARGYVEFYKCTTCGCKLGRDLDDKDPGANWYKI